MDFPPGFLWIRISAVSLFLGRSWQHLRWDGPYRTLFWDESIMRPVVEQWGNTSWAEYVTNPVTDLWIQGFTRGVGVCLLVGALAVFFLEYIPKAGRWLIGLGTFLLVILAVTETKSHFGQAGLLLEYTLQWFTPVLILKGMGRTKWESRHLWWAALACSLTFLGHGLYALGWYPRPGYFVQMTLTITGLSEANCIRFLQVAGVLDLMVAVGIFLSAHRIRIFSAAYMVLWGLITAMARLVAHFVPAFWQNSLDQWLHEVLFRLPHGLIPLFLVVVWMGTREK